MAEAASEIRTGVPDVLIQLAATLDANPQNLVLGDEAISSQALAASKEIFDLAIGCAQLSAAHLGPFLASIREPQPQLRSQTRKKGKKAPSPTPEPEEKGPEILPNTLLTELTTTGLDAEQIWQQIEIQSQPMVETIKAVIDVEEADDEDGPRGDEGDSSESDSDEDELDLENLTEEEIQKLMEEASDSEGDSDDGDSEEDSEDGSDDDRVDFYDDEDAMLSGSDEEGDEDEEGSDELGSDDDELDLEGDEEEDDEDVGMEDGESDLEDGADEDEEDEDDEDGEEESEEDVEEDDQPVPGPSRDKSGLNDGFFNIDEFNRLTEEAEAGRVTSGRLGGDDDDEDDDDALNADISSLMLRGAPEEDSIMYQDFFEPPRPQYMPGQKGAKGKGKAGDKAAKSKGKGKGKQKARFEDDEVGDEMGDLDGANDDDDDGEDQERGVMGRVKVDLFDDEDDAEEPAEQKLSTFEKRQRALAEQIAELESEAIGPKDWTLLGEATSRARPENSLLEENLDFEQMGKVVPVITEETVKSLEDMIKARIIDNNFDSPVRVRAYEPTPFLPSRYFELQDTQSSKSLAQIYEEEYQAAAAGGKTADPRDEKLKKEHDEIQRLWDEVCYKLDALSSLNFVPKQPKAQISTISNLPTTSMETALPPTSSASTLLAPQEVFAAPSASGLVARSELTPEEAQKSRQKARKAKQAQKHKLEGMAELYGSGKKKRKSAKEEKEEALKSLVKTGKGVTVVGKGDKEAGKAQKRGQVGGSDGPQANGSRLKL